MYVQCIYMMRLRCYELYVQPRAELISSSDMVIEMHRMAYCEIRLKMFYAEKGCDIYVRIIFWETIQVLRRGAILLRKE